MNGMMHIFLDIEGTYTVLNDSEKKHLIELIDQIRALKNYEKSIISFVSTLECSLIEESFVDDLKTYISDYSNRIAVGPMIGCDGFFYNGKHFQLSNYLSKAEAMLVFIKREIKEIDLKEVMYADDNPNINPVLLTAYLHRSKIDLPINFIAKNEFTTRKLNISNSFIEHDDKFLVHGLEDINQSLLHQNKTV